MMPVLSRDLCIPPAIFATHWRMEAYHVPFSVPRSYTATVPSAATTALLSSTSHQSYAARQPRILVAIAFGKSEQLPIE